MSNLNVAKLKQLYPKNSRGRNPGAGRVRVQVVLPPDVLARLDGLVGADGNARSAAVALACDLLSAVARTWDFQHPDEIAKELLQVSVERDWMSINLRRMSMVISGRIKP